MTLKDWLKLDASNKCVIQLLGDEVVAYLYNGDSPNSPERWRGKGEDETKAIAAALSSRERVRSQLP